MRYFLWLSIMVPYGLIMSGELELKPFDQDRDYQAIRSIINAYPDYLDWDRIGCPSGTTDSYFLSGINQTTVARIDGMTIGFVNFRKVDDVDYRNKKRGRIELLGVCPSHQRNGYGSILLASALATLKKTNISSIELGVKAENITARRLYERHGFKEKITYCMCGVPHLLYELALVQEPARVTDSNSTPTSVGE